MSVTLEKREGFKKYVGYFEGEVIAVNPDMEKLNSLGITVDKEPEYSKEVEDKDKDGNVIGMVRQANVVFLIKEKKTNTIFRANFFLKNKIRMDNAGIKYQFLNSQGSSGWAVSEEKLQPFMTKFGQTVRKAYEGEADLYDFIKTWLNNANHSNKSYELSFDFKKLINGNAKEIRELIGSGITGSIMVPATVKTTDEGKSYQQVFTKGIISGYNMKQLRVKKLDDAFIEGAVKTKEDVTAKKEGVKLSDLQRSVLAITDGGGKYKCKDFYYLGEMKEYNEEEDFVAGNKVAVEEKDPDDNSY